jgi:predicted metal-dependent enzyme (double-stranded beta helix superfamily)
MYSLLKSISRINSKNIHAYRPLLEKYNDNTWKKYIIKTDTYDKYSLYEDDLIEVVMISWNKGCSTKIHSHPENGCILKVLDGNLIETFYDKKEIINNNLLPNQISIRYGGEKHMIYAKEKSYSIHIYSPPGFYKN